MAFYRYHLFVCANQRPEGEACCGRFGAAEVRTYMKDRIKALGLKGPGGVRINSAGCLGRCEQGPIIVVYPDETWYTYVDREDVDEIIEEHLVHHRPVKRLMIDQG